MNATTGIPMCSEDFYFSSDIGACLPDCGEWRQYESQSTVDVVNAITILSAIINVVASIVLLVLSCWYHKKM